ncbi:MAG: hypothetical protein DRH24_16905, partial [Deltaproteobacteria bacterium]
MYCLRSGSRNSVFIIYIVLLVALILPPIQANASKTDANYALIGQSQTGRSRLASPGDSWRVSLLGRWARGMCMAVATQSIHAYISDGGQLDILNCYTPSTPMLLGKVVLPYIISDIAVDGDYAYVSCYEDGLRIIDVSDSFNPVEVGHVYTNGYAQGVAVSGSYAYVASYGYGLRVIDISDPTNPVEVGHFDAKNVVKVKISGNFAYLAEEGYGI